MQREERLQDRKGRSPVWLWQLIGYALHSEAKLAIFPFPRDVTNQTLPGNNQIILRQEEFG